MTAAVLGRGLNGVVLLRLAEAGGAGYLLSCRNPCQHLLKKEPNSSAGYISWLKG